jgi:molybdopterin-synthase adenylyltransferase
MVYFQDDEIARYSRHIILPEVGGRGQQLLKHSSVLVIGAGGLGAPVLVYLAAAGLGRLGVVDDDEVELSNLQRQIIHGTPDVGRLKVDSATDMLGRLNPWVVVEPHPFRLTQHNVDTVVAG